MRIAIIGAGAAGLASARHATAEGMECEVFEMKPELGGTWIYTDDVDKDQYGLPVYSSMYKNLIINVPKEMMGFPDFPIPEQERCYLTQAEILEFLNNYVDHFNLKELIRLNRMVTEVQPLEDKWQVKSIDKPSKEEFVSIYDAVMVCTGAFNVPFRPKLSGEEKFKGKISHSQQYRTSESFTDQKVLVIGGGTSGVDLVQHISFVAQHVVLSYHTETTTKTEFRSNVSKKPDVFRIKNDNEVEFIDNSCDHFDSIVYCTGYKYSFPFLDGSCGITVDDNNIVQPLYKQVINIEKPTMCFIGIPIRACFFQLFDLQARFFCKYLTGAKSLPSSEEMRADTEKMMKSHWAKGYTKRQTHFLGPEQQSYYDDLAATADIKSVAPVFSKIWIEAMGRLYNNFQNFREDKYKIIDNKSYIRV